MYYEIAYMVNGELIVAKEYSFEDAMIAFCAAKLVATGTILVECFTDPTNETARFEELALNA